MSHQTSRHEEIGVIAHAAVRGMRRPDVQRPLLLLSTTPLPSAIRADLATAGWRLMQLASARGAAQLAAGAAGLGVGLLLLPATPDPAIEERLLRRVLRMPDIHWIAAVSDEQLARPEIRSCLAQHFFDYQRYPLDSERLTTLLQQASGMAEIRREWRPSVGRAPQPLPSHQLRPPALSDLEHSLQRAAASDAALLICGPQGSGKELIARAVHERSRRANAPFLLCCCRNATPSGRQLPCLSHSHCGWVARSQAGGLIQEADGGTLFLERVDQLTAEGQAALLRLIDNQIATPVSGRDGGRVDVRILASSDVPLEVAVREGRFRADLYYCLAVLRLDLPIASH